MSIALRSAAALLLLALLVRPVRAQVATVDVSDTSNPAVSFDPDPQIYFPDIPEDITRLYLPDPVGTAGAGVSAAQTQNAIAVAAIALGLEGLITSTVGYEDAGITAQEPTVTTAKPDTYSLMTGSKAAVYYIDPVEPAGPTKSPTGPLYFDFGTAGSPLAAGYTRVTELTAYANGAGYGWGDISKVTSGDAGWSDGLTRDYCRVAHGRAGGAIDSAVVSPTPFYVDLPNGTYKISVLSAPDKAGDTSRLSVWAEGAPEIVLSTNKSTGVWGSFTINIHDGRLMLEFFNSLDKVESATDPNTWAYVQAVTIEPVPDDPNRKPVLYVASDSTAASYSMSSYPLTGWGARLSYFLTDDIEVANYAVAGASSKSFYEHRWLRRIENRIKPGDFFFVMFAINDSADDLPGYPATKRKTSPASTFKAYLRQYVKVAEDHGATPVFVTSQTKRTYDMWGRFTNSVGAYPQAMWELAEELDLPLIDLNAMSIAYLDAIGVEASADVYMFFPAGEYPDTAYKNGAADYTHLQDNGATQYAHLIMDAVRQLDIEGLAPFVRD